MDFEERLNQLVDEARAQGVSNDEIISAFELKTMALNDTEHEDGETD